MYLIGYFALIAGAAASLWRAGVLSRIPPTRLALIALVVIGLAVVLALVSDGSATPKIPKRPE